MGEIALKLENAFSELLAILTIDVITAAVPLEAEPRSQTRAHTVVHPTEPVSKVSESKYAATLYSPFSSHEIHASTRKHDHMSRARQTYSAGYTHFEPTVAHRAEFIACRVLTAL